MSVLSLMSTYLLLAAIATANLAQNVVQQGRITRGNPVSEPKFPFMACLVGYNFILGYRTGAGTIISDFYVLTSAHFTSRYLL